MPYSLICWGKDSQAMSLSLCWNYMVGEIGHHSKYWGTWNRGICVYEWMNRKMKWWDTVVTEFTIWCDHLWLFTQNTLFHAVLIHLFCLWSWMYLTLISYMPPFKGHTKAILFLSTGLSWMALLLVRGAMEWYWKIEKIKNSPQCHLFPKSLF